MNFEDRISYLGQLINKNTVEEINAIYKAAEVEKMTNYFTKHPDVKYSEEMKKRMIREAKSKKISKSRMDFIQSLIDLNNDYEKEKTSIDLKEEVLFFLDSLANQNVSLESIGCIYFEHDYDPKKIHCHLYTGQEETSPNSELCRFVTNFDFSPIWGFLNKYRFESLSESLEIIEVEGQEYPLIFEELFKLRAYSFLKQAFHSDEVKGLLSSKFQSMNCSIKVGEHDHWSYEIFSK